MGNHKKMGELDSQRPCGDLDKSLGTKFGWMPNTQNFSNTKISSYEAILCVRESLVGSTEILPMLTTVQINDLDCVCKGRCLFDLTTETIKTCCGEDIWK